MVYKNTLRAYNGFPSEKRLVVAQPIAKTLPRERCKYGATA